MKNLITHMAGDYKSKILSAEEEHNAAIAWLEHGCQQGRQIIIQSHTKLVAREVRRMRFYNAEWEDLFSEGMHGLVVALDKFDPHAGVRFNTYALHWIRAKIIGHVMKTEGTLRLTSTRKFKRLFFSYRQAAADIARKAKMNGEMLTREEVMERTATLLNVDIEDLKVVEIALSHASSLDAPIGDENSDGNATLGDTLIDTRPTGEETAIDNQVASIAKARIAQAMEVLSDREKHIITARQLTDAEKVTTLDELSLIYKVSRERIRQIEVAALGKLKAHLEDLREMAL